MYQINIQITVDKKNMPSPMRLRAWALAALASQQSSAELTIRVVSKEEMTDLNSTYRKKSGPTNVLSFPFQFTDIISLPIPMLGDIILCKEVIENEAISQHKTPAAHWAHMIVHGVYHLLGYNHEKDEDANIMEALEIKTLKSLGFPDPYQ